MKFKNLRRPARATKAGVKVPPLTKKKLLKEAAATSASNASASDMAEYKQHVSHIQKSYASHNWSLPSMVILLELTASQRRKWITAENPSVMEILSTFPCLKEPKLVSACACTYIALIML